MVQVEICACTHRPVGGVELQVSSNLSLNWLDHIHIYSRVHLVQVKAESASLLYCVATGALSSELV